MSAKKVSSKATTDYHGVVYALLLSNLLSVFLYLLRVFGAHDFRYWFLFWNLALAWLPLLFAWQLLNHLERSRWLNWVGIILTFVWLGFLPNSFYLISDLIHLKNTGEVSLLFDAVLFISFIFNGFVSGFISLYIVHRELLRRIDRTAAHSIIAGVILLCSFAIYLGRSLRWNTWDVLVKPAGVIFDVSERIINPVSHPQSFVTTFTFFALIGTMYMVVWQLVKALKNA